MCCTAVECVSICRLRLKERKKRFSSRLSPYLPKLNALIFRRRNLIQLYSYNQIKLRHRDRDVQLQSGRMCERLARLWLQHYSVERDFNQTNFTRIRNSTRLTVNDFLLILSSEYIGNRSDFALSMHSKHFCRVIPTVIIVIRFCNHQLQLCDQSSSHYWL